MQKGQVMEAFPDKENLQLFLLERILQKTDTRVCKIMSGIKMF